MNNCKTFLLFCFLLPPFSGSKWGFTQDIHFSQVGMAPLLNNPAFAGINHNLRIISNYKNQWNSLAYPFETAYFSLEMKLNKKKAKRGFLAAGSNISNDVAGEYRLRTVSQNIFIAYHVFLNEQSTIGGGLMAGYVHRWFNYFECKWMSQYDGMQYNSTINSGEPDPKDTRLSSFAYPDIGGGLLWNYNKQNEQIMGNEKLKATVGIAIFHPHQPIYSFYFAEDKLLMKTIFHANVLYGIKNTNYALEPIINFSLQGSARELILGSLINYTLKEQSKITGYNKGSAISIGAYYRNKDAIIPMMLLEFSQYAIGISYDLNTSGLTSATRGKGGIEISLRFVNPNPFLNKQGK